MARPGKAADRAGATRETELSLLLLLVGAHQRMAQLVERELARDGVEADGYALLSVVGVRGAIPLTRLAAELGLPLTTASDAVRRLERRGLVRRSANPADRRSSLLELTREGDAAWRRGWDALRRIDEAVRPFLADEATMRATLVTLAAAFEEALGE